MNLTAEDIKRAASGSIFSALLFSMILYAPPLGFFCALASPLPLAHAVWGGRLAPTVAAMMICAAAITALLGAAAGLEYLVQFALGGLIIGIAIKRDFAPHLVIGAFASIGLVLFGVSLLTMAATQDMSPAQYMAQLTTEWLAPLREAVTEQTTDPKSALAADEWLDGLEKLFTTVPMGIIAGFGIFVGWLNATTLRRILAGKGVSLTPWSTWKAPDALVWLLIAAGALILLAPGGLASLGANILLPCAIIYFLQGLAIVQNVLDARGASGLVRMILFGLIFLNMGFFTPMLATVGVFDTWVDFRQRLAPTEE